MSSSKDKWSSADSTTLFNVDGWAADFFFIDDAGNVCVRPDPQRGEETICMRSLIGDLEARGIQTPVLIRFADILHTRITALNEAFGKAINACGYTATYQAVYPIKVNEQHHVVETVLRGGDSWNIGLEVGSKPELLTAMGMLNTSGPLLCNGYKDEEFIDLALVGRKLGMNVIPVVEKAGELSLILKSAAKLDVTPVFGLRSRLSSRGSGRWHASSGNRAKFGLTASEISQAVAVLEASQQLDCLRLIHFHIGSQICEVGKLRKALREAARFYVELRRLGAPIEYLDIGGGLAVDYDGTRTTNESSANYTVEEYASTVVNEIKTVCDEAGEPHPIIISESGRALTAHHAVLVTDVLGVRTTPRNAESAIAATADAPRVILDLLTCVERINAGDTQKILHDLRYLGDQLNDLFRLGTLNLHWRGVGESLYWSGIHKCYDANRQAEQPSDEALALNRELADIYFCNLSIFQSLPDVWAIDQVFPILPIQRLNERPQLEAVLADITCDSDGKIDRFVGPHGVTRTLPVHNLCDDETYYLGVFLVGAYQEVLGDLHNLFGDTNAVHIEWDPEAGAYGIDHVEDGDTVTEVLSYMQHTRDDLISRFRRCVERRVRANDLTPTESRQLLDLYRAGFEGYTYME